MVTDAIHTVDDSSQLSGQSSDIQGTLKNSRRDNNGITTLSKEGITTIGCLRALIHLLSNPRTPPLCHSLPSGTATGELNKSRYMQPIRASCSGTWIHLSLLNSSTVQVRVDKTSPTFEPSLSHIIKFFFTMHVSLFSSNTLPSSNFANLTHKSLETVCWPLSSLMSMATVALVLHYLELSRRTFSSMTSIAIGTSTKKLSSPTGEEIFAFCNCL